MKPLSADEFARRHRGKDMEGLLDKRATVHDGEVGLAFRDGKLQSVAESRTALGSLLERLGGHTTELVKVRTGEVTVAVPAFHTFAPGRLANVECSVIVQYVRGQEGAFVANLMYGRDCLTCADLGAMLLPAVRRASAGRMSDRKLIPTTEGELRDLEAAMVEAADSAMRPKGVSVVRASAEVTVPGVEEGYRADEAQRREEAELARLERRALVWDRIAEVVARLDRSRYAGQGIRESLRSLDADRLLPAGEIAEFAEQVGRGCEAADGEQAHAAKVAEARRDAEYERLEEELAKGSGATERITNCDHGERSVARRLALLEVNNCNYMRITCKKRVARIKVINSDDIVVVAEGGYGGQECVNSDRVRIVGE